ncbi:histidine phosphatase family protein [Actinoallomurus bryophytorum]|uniref:Phosphohistidine phosphatase n=1 Tax=Actinoallomurus bryophytorum TaxID=1490222 RepID=A0A543CJS7_9ACTN|nr:histidine phosphatase family protein [Actinoallomurus bryophytorum]TQL97364.1 phosphohistidine phosphatase [Actinoallomurus bryophytorum]
MPTLIVLRHSKAASPLGTPDADRPLAGRGRRDAEQAGDELRAAELSPDHVICSTSLRTRQTLEGLGLDVPVDFEPRVYGNDADDILDLLREQSVETLLLVGHNPSAHQLVVGLTGTSEDHFPTSATAVIEFDGEWSDLWPGTARLVSFWVPRG